MRRREFIKIIGGGAVAWPMAAHAQQPERMRRLGVLMAVAESDADVRKGIAIFQQRLQELGWKDGRNIQIDYRWGDADAERIQALAKELVDLKPDALVGHSTPSAKGLLKQTRSIPIVFLTVTDPLGQGLVASLSNPGGNITGFSVFEFSLGSKWLEALKQIAPGIRRVTAMFNPATAPYYGLYLQSIDAAIRTAPGHFSCRANPPTIGVHPQTDQQLRIKRRPPTFLRTALDGLIKRTQVQPPYQCPNGSRRMVFAMSFSTSTARQLICCRFM